MKALCAFDWPGNIRQLQNVLERATAFTEKEELQEHDVQHLLKGRAEGLEVPKHGDNRGLTLREVERNAFIQT